LNIHNCIPTQSIHNLNVNKSSNTSTLKPTIEHLPIDLEVNTEPEVSILTSPDLPPLIDLTSELLQKHYKKMLFVYLVNGIAMFQYLETL